jgi:hypothetical protein
MSGEVAPRSFTGRLRPAVALAAMLGYCLVLFLLFDFAYSRLTHEGNEQPSARVANPVYHHGFLPKFEGHEFWGELRYPFFTNSLGFKDASTREVPLKSSSRRILLMGDSFTEGIGMRYEDSFAGLLQQAGQERSDKIEFLNGGVVSYSPSIYYKKIKYLLDIGLQFDEVLLFSDISDVNDEATHYFCIDDDPKYRAYCNTGEDLMRAASAPVKDPAPKKGNFFIDHFTVTNRVHTWIRRWVQFRLNNFTKALSTDHSRISWAVPGFEIGDDYKPLGVEGGIQRSLQNMGKLADLLAARNIPLTIVVYPWAQQIAHGDRDSRQVSLWRDFCAQRRCKAFINLYPAFFAAAVADKDWYEHLYIMGDDHFSAAGNRMAFEELEKRIR